MCTSITIHGSENVKFGTGTRYGLEGPGIEFRWRRDFPHPWIGPRVDSASYIMGYRRYSVRSVAFDTYLHLEPRLEKQ